MFKNKYSNFLTMFLVILIVAIIGIVVYFVYDMFYSNTINSNAQSALDDFEKSTTTVKKDTSNLENNVNEIDENAISMDDLANKMLESDVADTPVVEETPDQTEEVEKVYMEGYEIKGRIEIPKTSVDYPILDQVTKKSLEIAVGIAYGPGPNEVGNTVIYGHNYRNGLFFSNNKKLSNGDSIFITDQYGNRIEYVIYNIYQTTPNDASFFRRETNGKREISLQTCTDNSAARIIIWAAEKE